MIRDGRMEVGDREVIIYTYRYTATTRITPALRWTAMRERHFNVFNNREGQSHKTVSTNHNLPEEKGVQKWNRAEALLLTSLTPYR